MSWLAVKLFFQKAWVWAKNHWKILALLIYTFVLYLLFSKKARNAKEILRLSRESHKKEIENLNKAHVELINKRDQNLEKYKATMAEIEKRAAEENKKIDEDKKKRVKEIIEEAGDDPNKLAELIKDTFGFEIRRRNDE